MKKTKITILIVAVLIALTACKKADEYPILPAITFKSLTTQRDAGGFDTKGVVTISFTDGDGDLGYFSSGNGSPYDDTLSQYYYNFIVKFFEKKSGVWTPNAVNLTGRLNGRMPYLTPEGTNKALKGDIAMDLFLPTPMTADTVRYDIFIYDRGLHQSNTITTSELIINTH